MIDYRLSDEELDQRLRGIALPEGLIGRLQQAVRRSDVELDNALAEVPLPAGMITRLVGIAARKDGRRLQYMALAASLFLAVGLCYGGAWVIYVSGGYRVAQRDRPAWLDTFLPDGTMQITGVVEVDLPSRNQLSQSELAEPLEAVESSPGIELADVEPAAPIPVFPSPFPVIEGRHGSSSGVVELGLEAFGADVLGSSQLEEGLPELQLMPRLIPRGAPLAKDLYTSRLPLTVSQESYLLARRFLSHEELPPDRMIHTDEFLAGGEYAFARPANGETAALTVAGGPSPFLNKGPTWHLLQVGVQTAELAKTKRNPSHLIICVDVSASMHRGARLEQAQTALHQLVRALAPADRLSLVVFDRKPQVFIEDAGSEHSQSLAAAIDAMRAGYGSHPIDAVRLAYGMAAEYLRPGYTQQVLLLTDGLFEIEELSTLPLEAHLRASIGRLAPLWIVDLSHFGAPPAHWHKVVEATEGKLRQADTTDEIRWTLLEALTGQSQKVAVDATLTVAFNPKSVARYRVLGQQPTLPVATEIQTNLYSGQSSSGLYEIQLLPKGADHVATVTLAWQDAVTKKSKSLTRPVTRGNFAKQFAGGAPSLQIATLAAGLAGLLKHEESVNAALLRDLAGLASEPVQGKKTYRELVELLRQAEQAKPTSPRMQKLWREATP